MFKDKKNFHEIFTTMVFEMNSKFMCMDNKFGKTIKIQ